MQYIQIYKCTTSLRIRANLLQDSVIKTGVSKSAKRSKASNQLQKLISKSVNSYLMSYVTRIRQLLELILSIGEESFFL